jgi:hypothetical protein
MSPSRVKQDIQQWSNLLQWIRAGENKGV